MLDAIASNPNEKNVSMVKNTLSNLGFYHVWASQGVGNVKNFLTIFKQRLRDNFIQNWEERLHASSRADFYKQIQWIFVPRLWNLFWGVLSLADKRIAPWMAVSRLPRQRSRSDTQPHFKSTRSQVYAGRIWTLYLKRFSSNDNKF